MSNPWDEPSTSFTDATNATDLSKTVHREYKNSLFQQVYLLDKNSPKYFADLVTKLGKGRKTLDYKKLIPITMNNSLLSKSQHDVAYWYDWMLLLMTEHQSTLCHNIAFRYLLYIAHAYEKWVTEKGYVPYLYKGKFPTSVPKPNFIVLYNGKASLPKNPVYKLNELFSEDVYGISRGVLNLEVELVDIRHNKLSSALNGCASLKSYSNFIHDYESGVSIDAVFKKFRNDEILGPILRKEGVSEMVSSELTQRRIFEVGLEEAKAEGRAEGEIIGGVKTLHKLNYDPNQIASTLNLKLEQINSIIKNLDL